MTNQTVYCSITSWVDCSTVLGEHYYARLRRRGCDEIDLEYTIGKMEAGKFDEPDIFGTSAEYKSGDSSTRFFSEEKLRRLAVCRYRTLFPGASLLVVGRHYTAQPQEILNGPRGLRAPANVIFRKCEELDWWESGHDSEVEALMRKWLALVLRFDIQPWWHPLSLEGV